MKRTTTALLGCAILAGAGCSTSDGDADCDDGKCDTPGGSVAERCENSRGNALDQARPHFTADAIRWSCRDVSGVTPNSNESDDRGQEYCEYFAVLEDGIPEVAFTDVDCFDDLECRDLGHTACHPIEGLCIDAVGDRRGTGPGEILGKNVDTQSRVTPIRPNLSAGQVDWLEFMADPDEVLGACVFTSWHRDQSVSRGWEVRSCADRSSCPEVAGWPLDARIPGSDPFEPSDEVDLFRMQISINGNSAAQALVRDCLGPGDEDIEDDYDRGCFLCGDVPCEPFRKSDPSVCTAAMKIAECGCEIAVNDGKGAYRTLDLSSAADRALAFEALVPKSRRGFTLGSWDGLDRLPRGCRFLHFGDEPAVGVGDMSVPDPFANQQAVACDLTASMFNANDPKQACAAAYGEEIVVHVRLPDPEIATVTCNARNAACTSATPWVVVQD
jgi:hypothetical protein